MILHHHGQPLFGRIERRALGNGPRFQRAVDFQAQIVVQMSGVMALDAELTARPGCGGDVLRRSAAPGSGRNGAFSRVFLKRQGR